VTPQEFIAKWQAATLSERSACQQHFLDLCELLGQPKPAAADPEGAWYCFERGVSKTEGGWDVGRQGWADVWMRGHFGWEYKGKHKDLKAAYSQLLQYRESLEPAAVFKRNDPTPDFAPRRSEAPRYHVSLETDPAQAGSPA